MASGKKESEAFNMLKFMYQDDDDDMEDADRDEDGQQPSQYESDSRTRSGAEDSDMRDSEQQESVATDADEAQDQQQQHLNLRPRTPLADALPVDSSKYKRERPTIVDYGHDEAAMSPEPEEGEILANGRAMHDLDAKNAIGDFQEGAMAGNVEISLTPSIHLTPPPSVRIENSVSDVVDNALKESGVGDLTGTNVGEDVDPLDKFLPPPPKDKCSEVLQDRINKFLALKRMGKSFNSEVRNRKDYRNPDFLLHAVSYQDIDQTGSCFSKDVFDPHGYDERDYYDAIEVDMKLEMERKEQERKKSPKVDFISAGTQQAAALAAAKISMSVSGVPNLPTSVLPPASVSADALSREGRQNKKSKWDKVDGDQRPALGGGQVSQTAIGAHATFLSAANAGSGYAMFAQQKRREEERRSSRSSERKVDRRS